MSDTEICDVLVIGAGAGGLAAAVAAGASGLKVLVVEKEKHFGGTAARSGGGLWIPANPVAADSGIRDSREAAREYIRTQAGNAYDSDLIDVYLQEAPRMLEFFSARTALKFIATAAPDHHPEIAGGAEKGRALHSVAFDATELGEFRDRIAPPLREQTFLGMAIERSEVPHFMKVARSPRSALIALQSLARHLAEVVRYGRGIRLVNGNALAGRLLRSALNVGVELWSETRAARLDMRDRRVRGAVVERNGELRTVVAQRAVVLASGGFTHDPVLQKQFFAHVQSGDKHWSPVPSGNTGDGIRLGEEAGGHLAQGYSNPTYWLPVSILKRKDGSFGVFPHLALDRGKPGMIAVNRKGERFVNEAVVYHEFVEAMFRTTQPDSETCAFLICDHRAIRRYGLGAARPFPLPLRPYLRAGYITHASSILGLAQKLGVDPDALAATVQRYNDHARNGEDPDFSKGSTVFERFQGDDEHRPNPCIGPLDKPPFYAVKLLPGDAGTFIGLRTDRHARVLDDGNEPVEGLYAVGNDMANIFGGFAPGGGISIGPALTFGYLAARHIVDGAGGISSGAGARS